VHSEKSGHPYQVRPVAAIAGAMSPPESFGSAFSDHHSTRHQLKSKEKVNPIYPRRFW
jgi:hypothetical protein